MSFFLAMLHANISSLTGLTRESMLSRSGLLQKMFPGCVLYHIRCQWASSHWLLLTLQLPSSTRVDIYPKVQPPRFSFQEEADLTL